MAHEGPNSGTPTHQLRHTEAASQAHGCSNTDTEAATQAHGSIRHQRGHTKAATQAPTHCNLNIHFYKGKYVWEGRNGRDESERQRAESQRIVAARPLCRLQYPVAYLSRLQRILPAARWKLYFKAANAARPLRWLGQRHVPLGAGRPLLRVGKRTAGVCIASSPDSDLEAFSHNPAHGSFAPLAFQPSAMTNCANQRFLSY
ncbi:Uncharacterized protein Adt_49207 [Abeliophyllum distichum]|uniref:Uncharacterized protein n=1 Tax=Abeliophyllum distichum TaxID=126358 RepID=A0ABD1NNW8_9LAMI